MKLRPKYKLHPLDKNKMELNWSRFVEIDKPHVEAGNLEDWNENHFKHELIDKWELSYYVEFQEQIIGYRIVSGQGKIPNYSHTHRTSIDANFIRSGIASLLLKNAIEQSKKLGYKGLTGLLNPNNSVSRKFLLSTGWKQLDKKINGNELWKLEFTKT